MTGGILNLVSYGSENLILNGKPKKTFFTTTYKKYTNFGMQKFRLDYQGQRILGVNDDVNMTFKVARYGDLLSELFLVVNIPDIWSPLYYDSANSQWVGYEFKWIEELGSSIVRDVTFTIGGQVIAKFTGEYLSCLKERDYSQTKKDLWNRLTFNVPEYNDPANVYGRGGYYPHAFNTDSGVSVLPDVEPSIRGGQLFLPIDAWFSAISNCAIPLVCLQYNELHVSVNFRPINELFTIRDVTDHAGGYPRMAPKPNVSLHQMYRFLQPPPYVSTTLSASYANTRNDWNADIHLWGTFVFLDDLERRWFAGNDQKYLVRDIYEYDHQNQTGNKIVNLDSRSCVAGYMWRFRRTDVKDRNQWTNYTNWEYPDTPTQAITTTGAPSAGLRITGRTNNANQRNVLVDMSILMDGKVREETLPAPMYSLCEKYYKSKGNAKDGLYCYNFALNTDPATYQPSGAMNMNRFKKIQFAFNTVLPDVDPDARFTIICDINGVTIGTKKQPDSRFKYGFDLHIFEERYNILLFTAGNGALQYTR